MLECYALITAAVLLLGAITGLVVLGLSSHRSSERYREDVLHLLAAKDQHTAQAVLGLAQAITRQSEELTKSNDRILAVADNRAYQSVKYQESGKPKKSRDIREQVVQV